MYASLRKLFAARKPARRSNRVSLKVETFEGRLLLSTTPITDMTQWASQFPRHSGPTVLYLNFDGGIRSTRDLDLFSRIEPFAPQSGVSRDQAIQDILYRTAEIFAPFDIQVERITGFNHYDSSSAGNTTVFIGGWWNNITTTSGRENKVAAAFTPWENSDYPGTVTGFDHRPNSDPYDLAYIDPTQYTARGTADRGAEDPHNWTTVWDDATISQNIAHEAGHTFGLAHTLTSPTPDVMSYDVGNQYFANLTFTITTRNYNPSTGQTAPDARAQPYSLLDTPRQGRIPIAMTTQDSFTYLQAVVGSRPGDGHAHWSDPNTIDPVVASSPGARSVGPESVTHDNLNRLGDYNVYSVRAARTGAMHLDVQATGSGNLDPLVMVRQNGGLIASGGHVDFQAVAGQTYYVVVGAVNGGSTGNYDLTVRDTDLTNFSGLSWALRDSGGRVHGNLQIVSEDTHTGSVTALFTGGAGGLAVVVTGRLVNPGSGTTTITLDGVASAGSNYIENVHFSGTIGRTIEFNNIDGSLSDIPFRDGAAFGWYFGHVSGVNGVVQRH